MQQFKIVTLSGPQGCGKTKTLEALQDLANKRHLSLYVDPFKASRSAQKALGISDLSNVVKTFDLMSSFQHAIVETRLQHEADLSTELNSDLPKVVVMERSFADIAAYYQLWAHKLDATHERRNVILDFVALCQEQYKNASHSLYLPFMSHMKFEYDPNRGFESDIGQFDEILKQELSHPAFKDKWSKVQGITPMDRAESIISQIQHLL